jgi:hypothetical protein
MSSKPWREILPVHPAVGQFASSCGWRNRIGDVGTDTRPKNFVGRSVELDAIPAARLRELVRKCIERHQLSILRIAEESERELLTKWGATYAGRT